MSSNQHQSDATTVSVGSRVNFFDSESGEFDLDRDPKDPTKPSHNTDEDSTDSEPRDLPSRSGMLDQDRGYHDYQPGVNREKWVASHILRSMGNPPLYCPECWHELDVQMELTEPLHHIPIVKVDHDYDDTDWMGDSRQVEKNDHRRHRHCPDCGCVSFGGVLADRPEHEFMEIVDDVLDAVDELVLSRRRKLKAAARSRKKAGESDESNMEQLVRDLRYNTD